MNNPIINTRLKNSERYVSRLNEGIFNFTKQRSFPAWGARKEWPIVNREASNPKVYVYVSRRVVIRNAP